MLWLPSRLILNFHRYMNKLLSKLFQLSWKESKVMWKARQPETNHLQKCLSLRQQDKSTYKTMLTISILTFAFWSGAIRQHNTAEQFLQTSMNSFSCSLSARERLVPSTTSPCWITWSSFILSRDKNVNFVLMWRKTLYFVTNYAVAHTVCKEVNLLDCFFKLKGREKGEGKKKTQHLLGT